MRAFSPLILTPIHLIICLLALGAGTLAHADTVVAPEPRGDAVVTTYDPDAEPCPTFTDAPTRHGDIGRLGVRYGKRDITIRMAVSGLDGTRGITATIPVRTDALRYDFDVFRVGRRVQVWAFSASPPPAGRAEAGGCGTRTVEDVAAVAGCDGARGAIKRSPGVVRIVVPLSCLHHPRWVRAGGSVTGSLMGFGWRTWWSDTWATRDAHGRHLLTLRVHRPHAG